MQRWCKGRVTSAPEAMLQALRGCANTRIVQAAKTAKSRFYSVEERADDMSALLEIRPPSLASHGTMTGNRKFCSIYGTHADQAALFLLQKG